MVGGWSYGFLHLDVGEAMRNSERISLFHLFILGLQPMDDSTHTQGGSSIAAKPFVNTQTDTSKECVSMARSNLVKLTIETSHYHVMTSFPCSVLPLVVISRIPNFKLYSTTWMMF